ncbi:MAG: dTDP-4-dehydrorhamnose reductase [Oligoflexia bacterium]|nr:dTDP-4-dehydrorhamnose reductase [Oligoflexia bacterium]
MKILLFGGTGQLGLEIKKRAEDLNFEVISPVISEVDITDGQQLSFLGRRVKPQLVINCAAYTDVDKAEAEPDLAFAINAAGSRNVALLCRELNCRLIHISTDFVFDGTQSAPINEQQPTNPISIYGKTKLEGEREILEQWAAASLIVRTSSLHGARGGNFVHTMLKLFAEREVVRVVNDRTMSATWAGWLAEAILDLGRLKATGIVHASCAGALTWFDFASAIKEQVQGKIPNVARLKLEAVSSEAFSLPAPRPKYSVFDCTHLTGLLGRSPISWREGLNSHLKELGY